jgi:hypothetical protein
VFKYLAGRGKHLAGVRLKIQREAEAKEAPLHKAESVKKETPGEIQHMRALISKLRSIASISSELADVFEVNYNENRDLKRKLRKVEEVLGRAIDNL